ncbi:MAG: error-prone DNA polymerase [Gammaproteobacteria bacterium]|nr:error-prone DNA polymerase [Gammaproteobacteria bacterium]
MANSSHSYAELHALSGFTFLRGASHPEELVSRAAELGYTALALTDECSFAGVVRAHVAAQKHNLKLIVGSEFRLADGPRLVLLAMDREGYGNLSQLITRGRRVAGKGDYHLERADLADGAPGCLALQIPPRFPISHWDEVTLPPVPSKINRGVDSPPSPSRSSSLPQVESDQPNSHPFPGELCEQLRWVVETFQGRAWLAVELLRGPDDQARLAALSRLGREVGLPLVAAGDVHMHVRSRRALQDTLTAIRLGRTLAAAGYALYPNGERHLRPKAWLAGIYPPELLDETLAIADRCVFSMEVLRYEYPGEVTPAGETPVGYLRRLVEEGMRERWPGGTQEKVMVLVEHELALIRELGYESYFLTVYDIVRFARGRGILCQGRGSAANSAVCFCLGITEVDPARGEMLFERFISRERDEPPDIDVDFEHERREEVIQYIYAKYGRERAALAAAVISYRWRSAVRDVGKALGIDPAQVDRLAKDRSWRDGSRQVLDERLRSLDFDPDVPAIQRWTTLASMLVGFPRHLSQHVGGFVISRGELSRLVPIENAAMQGRTVIQWDKDDLESLGLLKVDVLALGMLTAIRRALTLIGTYRGRPMGMADIPAEDPAVYAMIGHADTVGVFQIESRAQMAMLPRLKPANFYDLVIEVAIVRPGPIQGGMVHPYLRRRQGREEVTYPSPAVRETLERTLGVPIFQEQVMKLAVVAAGFTPGEADQLRRSMAAWSKKGGVAKFEERLIAGMLERGYSESFAHRLFQQIKGFGEYGFPESHAASFALLVYVSAWLKRHEPAAFTCALLNSQPMGFYSQSQLVQDARRHGVEVRPVDVRYSEWDCVLEKISSASSLGKGERGGGSDQPALRLGLRLAKGLSRKGAELLMKGRDGNPCTDITELVRCAELSRRDLESLAAAGALAGIAGDRHRASWEVAGVERLPPLLAGVTFRENPPSLPAPSEAQDLVADYASLGLTLGRHPLALLRGRLQRMGMRSAVQVRGCRHGQFVRAAGLVVNRQRPMTAAGVTFMTLEDETGNINLVVWQRVASKQRAVVLGARLLGVAGVIEREGEVIHLVAGRLEDLSHLIGELEVRSRDFC